MRAWWERQTLRFKLAMWYAVVGTLLLAGFSATLYVYVFERMARPWDYELRPDLEEIRKHLEIRPDGALWWKGKEIGTDAEWPRNGPWFALWDDQGRLVRRLWPFSSGEVKRYPGAPTPGGQTISVFDLSDTLRLRMLSVPFDVPGKPPWTIRVMRIHDPPADALGALRLIIFSTLPIVVALLVVGGYALTRRWLKPLDHMVVEANRITADDLSRRLPVLNPHDELGRLASVFNVTLDRLEGSFDALDRFVADASHELRTPLTTLRSVGEVGLRRGRTVEEYREIIGSMLEEAQRLQLLIQRLLELASAEGGAAAVQRSEIKVDSYVTSCVNELGVLAEFKNQQIAVDAEPCAVHTDAVIFRQALQNLVDNAIKYSPPNATIRVRVRQADGQVNVAVTDEGPGISPENRAHLMQRFFRPDRGRGRNSGGFGLGLSITKAYMRVLGGTLEYEPATPTGSTFRLRLPKA
jgi:two-component system, OmpR family, sensor kinase